MNDCEATLSRVDFYVDDELRFAELEEFESHLARCASCRSTVQRRRDLVERIRATNPAFEAPDELKQSVSTILAEAPVYGSPSGLLDRVRSNLSRYAPARLDLNSNSRWMTAVSTTLAVLVLGTAFFYILTGQPGATVKPPSAFAMLAVDNHIRHLKGQLPFEITSAAPEEISNWFAGKVNFKLTLPNYQESSGQERLYRLEGARLVGLDNDYAAYIGYRMGDRQIGLVVTSDKVAQPAGGEEIVSKGLRFHYDSLSGLKVISWSDRGLTYALVSDLEERGQESCVVCHEGTQDRDFIEGLKPIR